MSSSDESFSRTDFSRDEEDVGESPSPPSRPRSHAPWIYPSDIQIDPSSLEVSPKLQHASGDFPNGASDDQAIDDSDDDDLMLQPSTSREQTEDNDDLQKRLNLPHGVTAAESCRSASPGDALTDSYRGDSCGSFEFLTKSRRGAAAGESEDDEDDNRLFFPQRNEEKEAILRQIQTLNDGMLSTTEESRESSAQPPDAEEKSQASEVMEEIQKTTSAFNSAKNERSIPLVIAVAEAARNPRIRGKPSRLRDLQQPVPMEENIEDKK